MSREALIGKQPLAILEKIKDSLDHLNAKLDIIIELQKTKQKEQTSNMELDVMTLLNMPDHLRKTAIVLCRVGWSTAKEVADQTNRARAVESSYLNQLVTMNYVKKQRKGRKTYFYIDRE